MLQTWDVTTSQNHQMFRTFRKTISPLNLKRLFFQLTQPELPADPVSFRHDVSSCRSRIPKKFSYRYIDPSSNQSFPYILLGDHSILNWRNYAARAYFGWLSESSAIIPEVIQEILNRLPEMEKAFVRIYTSDRSLLEKSACFEDAPNGSTLPWVKAIPAHIKKTRLLSIVASRKQMTEGHRLRDEAIRKFQPLDVFGQDRTEVRDKKDALWPYYFSVTIENASYPNYFTEKITDCFASKTVPIYWGNPKIGAIFNSKGILNYNEIRREDLTLDLYSSLRPAVEDNFQKTRNLELPDDIIYQKIRALLL